VHPHVLAIMVGDKNRSSVWAAEHGASSPAREEPEGANPGHRFRIHGRLGGVLPEQLDGEAESDQSDRSEPSDGSGPDQELHDLKVRLAQATEIDLADVWIEAHGSYIELGGTVADDGERRQLVDLVSRLTKGKEIKSRLLPRNP
jgi:hypothetical protein